MNELAQTAPAANGLSKSRKPWRRSGLAAAAALATLVLVAACSSSGGSKNSSTSAAASGSLDTSHPFKIGAILPLTGVYSSIGLAAEGGMKVAVDNINQNQHGILGREVELIVKDDAVATDKAVAAVRDLVTNEHVDALFPGAFTADTLAELPFTTQQKLVTITTTGTIQAADVKQFPYSFQLSIPFDTYPAPMATAIRQLAGPSATKVGLLVTTDSAGVAQGDVVNSGLQKLGFTITSYQKFDPTATDITPLLQKIKDSGAQSLVLAAPGTTVQVAMTGVRNLGWNVPVVGTNGTATGDLAKLIPAAVADQFHAVVFNQYARTDPNALPAADQAYVDQLQKQGAIQNLGVSQLHTDVITLIKWAYEKAGSTDQDKVRAALESLHNTALPANLLIAIPNPKFSPTNHTPTDADFSHFFSLIEVSPLLDGTFVGQPIVDK